MANASLTLPKMNAVYFKKGAEGALSFFVDMAMPDNPPLLAHTRFGAPATVAMLIDVVNAGSDGLSIDLSLRLYNKTATRLPESMWLRFTPQDAPYEPHSTEAYNWTMSKLGSTISPLEVCHNGSRHLHSVESVTAASRQHGRSMHILNLDAPVVAFGSSSPFATPDTEPALEHGISYALSNNIWGTNYVMWYPFESQDNNIQYRFRLDFSNTSESQTHKLAPRHAVQQPGKQWLFADRTVNFM